ncbi:MAG: EF-hand domain-containing protein [Sphingomonas sp.]|uniref:EF-hand domain-containing protein n=1 Tax=Sphingomonas sp. TaxID=28214 RepID=UPI0025D7FA8A|nr:EF-hand domain-containing protein [Sphingomonas sp.]MBX3566153.1 EF-hand domain-containing protein [Sphingomonas sp.]
MLKSILLATSMLVAAPVFAQDKPATAESQPVQTAPATTTEAPATDDAAPAATAAPATTAEASPQTAAPATPAQPAPVDAAAAQPAAAQPASSQEQVAMAVGRDFGTYDTDGDGTLNAAEFASWMSALRKAAEPSFMPDSPEAKTWAAQAFTTADADKSASVNKQELTTFLTPKPS